jgi:signal transduction histidine kinase
VVGFHRILRQARPRLERGLAFVAGTVSVTLLVIPSLYFFTAMLGAVALALVMAVYLLQGRKLPLFVPTVVVLVVGTHDVVAATTGSAPFGVLFSPHLPLLAIGATAWQLLRQHLASVEETAALNRTLERRVEDKHAELERNYARVQGLERERAVANERERIMQDVHDGVGGQLVSALALVESATHGPEELSDVLRGALEDLRLVIDSLDPTDCDLLAVLGTVRARLAPRLQRHGLQMRWDVREVAPLPAFGPEMALQVMRVVQEAVTNVVKHAGARTIAVRTRDAFDAAGRPGVCVEIHDDGRGYTANAPRGRGLTGMERRAARLDGRLDVASSDAGTTIRLWIPRAG